MKPNQPPKPLQFPSLSFNSLHFLSANRALSMVCAVTRAKKKIHCPSFAPKPYRTWRRWAGMIQNHHGALIPSLAKSIRATVSRTPNTKPPLGSYGFPGDSHSACPLRIALRSPGGAPCSVHTSQIAARTPSPACWGRWREAPDGVWSAASAQVGLHDRHRKPASIHPCFPHPIRRYAAPSPLRGEGGTRRPPPRRRLLKLIA